MTASAIRTVFSIATPSHLSRYFQRVSICSRRNTLIAKYSTMMLATINTSPSSATRPKLTSVFWLE